MLSEHDLTAKREHRAERRRASRPCSGLRKHHQDRERRARETRELRHFLAARRADSAPQKDGVRRLFLGLSGLVTLPRRLFGRRRP